MSKNNNLISNLTGQLREEEPSDLAAIEANKAVRIWIIEVECGLN